MTNSHDQAHPPWLDPPLKRRSEDTSPSTALERSSDDDALQPHKGRLSPSKARTTAVFMHMSILCGLPIFLLGIFFQRDDPFVLHHAKAAGTGFLCFYLFLLLGLLVWTPLFWVALFFYLPSLAGVWSSVRGERAGWLGLGHISEALFFPIQPRPTRSNKALDSRPPASQLTDGSPHHPRH